MIRDQNFQCNKRIINIKPKNLSKNPSILNFDWKYECELMICFSIFEK